MDTDVSDIVPASTAFDALRTAAHQSCRVLADMPPQNPAGTYMLVGDLTETTNQLASVALALGSWAAEARADAGRYYHDGGGDPCEALDAAVAALNRARSLFESAHVFLSDAHVALGRVGTRDR